MTNKVENTTSCGSQIKTIRADSIAKRNCAVVIPALNPMQNLPTFVQELLKLGISQIIVVNDGSDSSYNGVFQEIRQMERCTLITHPENRGKGRALKTAFTYFLKNFSHLDGVVTADADGQHGIEDICNICERLSRNEGTLILGVRNLKEQNVPKRSYIGNTLCSNIFGFLYNCYLEDTQTGLRGIQTDMLLWMTKMNGESYDYEINMLIQAKRHCG